MKEFIRFQDLFRIGTDTKKYETQLEKEAIKWFVDEFGAKFGNVSNHLPYGNKSKYRWAYSGGTLIFFDAIAGGYHYKWIIARLHFRFWKTKAYIQGYKYANKYGGRSRWSKNPYTEMDFVNDTAWGCGYNDGITAYYAKRKKK